METNGSNERADESGGGRSAEARAALEDEAAKAAESFRAVAHDSLTIGKTLWLELQCDLRRAALKLSFLLLLGVLALALVVGAGVSLVGGLSVYASQLMGVNAALGGIVFGASLLALVLGIGCLFIAVASRRSREAVRKRLLGDGPSRAAEDSALH